MSEIWKPTPKQAEFLRRGEFEAFFGGAAGPGKGSVLDESILTPFGWTKMGDIKVGSVISAASGKPTKVIGIYPLGKQQVFKFTLEHNEFCYVTEDHIWFAWEVGRPRETFNKTCSGPACARLYLTSQLRDMVNVGRKMVIPVAGEVIFTAPKMYKPRPINAYTLGAMLGDGSFSEGHVAVQTPHREIVDMIIAANKDNVAEYGYSERNHCWSLRFKNNSDLVGYLKQNELLGKHAYEKFIPDEYLWAPLEVRWLLLQGLLDTNGHGNEDGIEYSSASKVLAEQVRFLVMSLGGLASISVKESVYGCSGEKRNGKASYRVQIKFPDPQKAFMVDRKKQNLSPSPFMLRRIKSIEPVGKEEAMCIKIDDPSGLYITRDFIVTHNTDALIMGALRYIHKPNYRAIIFRRSFPQAQEIIDRTRRYYPLVDQNASYKEKEHRWYFSSGATIQIGHMQYEQDRFNYHGHEYHYVAFDELTQFTQDQYLYMFSRTRSTDPEIRPMVRSASNPGNIGHEWVKNRFVTITEPYRTYIDPKTGLSRVFIPAKVQDNPYLLESDPDYIQRLMLLPPNDQRRYLEGIWDTFEGQVFSELNPEIHGVEPLDIPPEWPRYRAFDWGYSSPFVVLWFAVDEEKRIWIYREWYGAKLDPDKRTYVGLKMTAAEIAREIKALEMRENDTKVRPGPADPSIFKKRMDMKTKILGRSVADEMAEEGVHWIPGDNDRIAGKHQIHTRLRLNENGEPSLFIFKNCEHFWRTMALMHEDPKNPEDVEEGGEDHIYDTLRYVLMFQPMRAQPPKRQDFGSFQRERQKYIRAKQYAARYGVPLDIAYGRVR